MIHLVFIGLFLCTTVQSEENENVVTMNGKLYKIIDEPPKSPLCKGTQVLEDFSGKQFCFHQEIDPDDSHTIYWGDISKFAECGRENLPGESRIAGGTLAEGTSRFPWIVKVRIPKGLEYSSCTGSIISKRIITTAGHCDTGTTTYFDLYVGSNDWTAGTRWNKYKGRIIKVVPKVKHDGVWRHDVLLVITERDIEFSQDVGPICLPKKDQIKEGMDGLAIGYGIYWAFQDMFLKYNLLNEDQNGKPDFSNRSQVTERIYKTFKDIIPDIENIFHKDMTLNKKVAGMNDKEIEKLAEDNLRKLETTLLVKITDSSDRDKFEKYYPEIFKNLVKFDYEMDIKVLPRVIIHTVLPDIVRYTTSKIISNDICEKLMTPNPQGFCVRASVPGCGGDSGGPLAVKINNKYYLGGFASRINVEQQYPIRCYCECKQYLIYYSKLDDDRELLIKALKENDIALPPGLEG